MKEKVQMETAGRQKFLLQNEVAFSYLFVGDWAIWPRWGQSFDLFCSSTGNNLGLLRKLEKDDHKNSWGALHLLM